MANDAILKPSLFLETLAPQLEEESFLNFLRAYYEWLQSTKLTFTGKVGNFTVGENIVGDDSKAKAIVKEIGSNYLVLKMVTDTPFDIKETFEGQTSGAIARVIEVKDNVIRAASRQQKNRDSSLATDKYFEYLKSEFNKGFPTVTEVDRRLIANKLKDFYKSKSNEDAYRFLFRSIYGLDIEFRYPGEEVLRVSDGDFEKTILVRAVPTDNIFNYLNQTIVGQTSDALGNVVDIKITFLGGIRYAELILKLVSGTFVGGETIYLLDDPTETTTIYGMVSFTEIVDAGSGYEVGDVLTVSGDGAEALAEVSSVSSGPINKIIVNTIGHGYRLGTQATINNSGTGGSGFAVKVDDIANTYTVTSGANTYTVGEISKVSIVNRGSDYFKAPTITIDDSTIKSLGLLSENLITIVSGGTNYAVGDALVFTGGAGANAAGVIASVGNSFSGTETLLFEDGSAVLQDNEVNGRTSVLKNEDWTNTGPILRVELTNFGEGYTATSLPTISVTSGAGASANLVATGIQGDSANVAVDVANNAVGLGAIRAVELKNFGIDYTTATIDASGVGDGNANVQPVISGIATTDGTFLTDDGKISVKILQDSLFYQDFSYVIRSGLVFNAYKELVKQSIHPAGLQFFGEILISSYILASAQFNSVVSIEREEMEVIIKQVLSFFPGTINPIVVETEKNLELELNVSSPSNDLEMNVEIVPTVIDQAMVSADGTAYTLRIEPELNIAIPAPTKELVVKIPLGAYHYNESKIAKLEDLEISTFASDEIGWQMQSGLHEVTFMRPRFLGEQYYNEYDRYSPRVTVFSSPTTISQELGGTSSVFVKVFEINVDATMAFYSQIIASKPGINVSEIDIISHTSVIVNHETEVIRYMPPTFVSVSSAGITSSYVNRLELTLDATLAFYSEIVTETSGKVTEIDIVVSTSLPISNSRTVRIEIQTFTATTANPVKTSYVPNVVLNVDIGPLFVQVMELDVQVASVQLESNTQSTAYEIEVAPIKVEVPIASTSVEYVNNITLQSSQPANFNRELELDIETSKISTEITNHSSAKIEFFTKTTTSVLSETELIKNLNPTANLASSISALDAEKDLAPFLLQINNFDQLNTNDVLFEELNPYTLSSFPISKYSSNTLLDTWESYGTVKKNLKVSGTVTVSGNTVIGTGTSFDIDFGTDKFIIINDEKMKVTNVANSTHLTVNVNPSGTYTNVSAYQEVFV